MTNKERVIDVLARQTTGAGVCDDCLATMARVQPRQQVNQICRRLLTQGRVTRRKGICSVANHNSEKLLNFLANNLVVETQDALNLKEQTDVLSQWLFDAGKFLGRIEEASIPREPFAARVARLGREGKLSASFSAVLQMLNKFRVQVVKERKVLDDQEWKLASHGIEKCRSEWLQTGI